MRVRIREIILYMKNEILELCKNEGKVQSLIIQVIMRRGNYYVERVCLNGLQVNLKEGGKKVIKGIVGLGIGFFKSF